MCMIRALLRYERWIGLACLQILLPLLLPTLVGDRLSLLALGELALPTCRSCQAASAQGLNRKDSRRTRPLCIATVLVECGTLMTLHELITLLASIFCADSLIPVMSSASSTSTSTSTYASRCPSDF